MNIITINNINPDPAVINNASDVMSNGGLVVYPTDTAYGIGVDATNEKAIKRLYRIKNRRPDKPTHVVVKGWDMISKLTITNSTAKLLFEKLIPGPLTLILEKRPDSPIPNILTGDLPSLGVRIPDYKITRMLSESLNIPYTTPSANREGEPSPYSVEEVSNVLDLNLVDMVLDTGPLPKNKPSTLVDLSKTSLKILREGPISEDRIMKVLKQAN